jgi:hypothetical protein
MLIYRNRSVVFGIYALVANTYGNANIAIGYHALASNEDGFNNTITLEEPGNSWTIRSSVVNL